MNSDAEDNLIRNLLRQADLTNIAVTERTVEAEHADEETLAMFAAGALTDSERASLLDHLARCPSCRELASLIINVQDAVEEDPGPVAARPVQQTSARFLSVLLAVAAVVVLAVALPLFDETGRSEVAERETYDKAARMLAQSDFAGARELVESAQARGIGSARLSSLDVQAMRGIPDPFALSAAGRLSDFGYGIGGVVAMGPGDNSVDLKTASQRLQQAGSESLEAVLNRGHVLLTMGDAEQALGVFDGAIATASENPLAWLGRGIAKYMLDDFAGAADDFRESLRLKPGQVSVQINLAMTLEELGSYDAAVKLWQELLKAPLSDAEKTQIHHNVEALQQGLKQ
ncbi:tetratricopeptide repeat protein [bacterium]|nr:tetratricopeptide repeat protein [bacterium]